MVKGKKDKRTNNDLQNIQIKLTLFLDMTKNCFAQKNCMECAMCSLKKINKRNNLRQKKIDLNNGLQFGTCMAITEYATPKKYR